LSGIDFQVEYKYSRPDLFTSGKNYFMVSNHMSYMDIIFLSAGEPSVFVTSVEMQNTPFLGEVSDYGGSYFVERRDRTKVPGEIKDLAKILNHGMHVFVFPEGTSTNGLQLLPFKRALFAAAVEAQREVLPVCLRIESINGEEFSPKNHNRVAWYGSAPFIPHFLQLMQVESMKVTVNYLDPIPVTPESERTQLAHQAYHQIETKYFSNRPAAFRDIEATYSTFRPHR